MATLPARMPQYTLCAVIFVCLIGSAPIWGHEPEEPGFNELIVLDPGVDENGLPVAQVSETGQVEIPPTLHVHAYYYSGNKEYQGPIIQGGPTIVVANHPKSGKKMYIDVTLPAGAPVIAYSKHSITYVYPNQRVVIEFPLLLHDHAVVKNVHGRGLGREARDAGRKVHEHMDEHHRQSRLSSELHEFARSTKNVVKGTIGVVSDAGATVVERARAVVQLVPGMLPLESMGEQADVEAATEEIRQAGLEQVQEETEFIPTLR